MTVIIAASLRTFTNRTPEVRLQADTVGDALQALTDEYPEAARGLYDENGDLRTFVSVYVGDRDIRSLKGVKTALKEGDEIYLIPAIAGGACESVISTDRMKAVTIEEKEIRRYSNHLQLKELSIKGQKRIMAGRVFIAGIGALGGVVAQHLAAAGVGTIGLADAESVSLESLQTQTIHSTRDVDRPRVSSAKDRIKKLNPLVNTVIHQEKLTADNVEEVLGDYDIVVDATDSFVSRYLINDACILQRKPEVFGAMFQMEGFVTILGYGDSPCLRCLYPSPPPAGIVPTCSASGVMNALPGILGAMMAAEVIKLLSGSGEPLIGRMLAFDTWNLRYHLVHTVRDSGCPVCGANPSIRTVQDMDYEDFCGLREDPDEEPIEGIDPEELARRLGNNEAITIVDVREPHERAIHKFPGTLIIPIGQLARRQKELDPGIDTVFVCKEGKRSILAIRTLREAGYTGPMFTLKGGFDAAAQIIFPNEGAWL
ncbi:MAG: ThiF family adenylyltransferase [Lachnospiraceae bacterium]|nr:ThiF family adenylyltransferase [Lachnospiraceae bacterium]